MASWAISSPHAASTRVGAELLERGGSAIDAALASAAALCVCLPNNVAVGGDLFALLHTPDGGLRALNSSGPAAAAASAAALRSRHGRRLPLKGADTVTVPGLLAGWSALRGAGATADWNRLLGPAIELARGGVEVDPQVAAALQNNRDLLAADPGMAATFFSGGQPLAAGELLRQPRLAVTLERIAADGAGAFYDGPIGEAWLRTMNARGSVLGRGDLAGFAPEWSAPVLVSNADQELVLSPPNSQSFLVGAILAELERCGQPLCDPLAADGAPAFARAGFHAREARDRLLADPRFAAVPVAGILAGEIDLSAGDPTSGTRSTPGPIGDGDTIGLVARDINGLAVTLIQSVFGSFGSGICCPETGIIAQNRGSFFSLEPGHPNEIEPGKRPAHTLSPVMIRERGALRHVIGTRGGTTQAQILAGVIQRLRLGDGPAAAVGAPRILSGSPDPNADQDAVHAEDDAPTAAIAALGDAGYAVELTAARQPEAGEVQVISIGSDGAVAAGSDPRSDGLALSG